MPADMVKPILISPDLKTSVHIIESDHHIFVSEWDLAFRFKDLLFLKKMASIRIC
jgi:hypothetical protein